MLRAGLAILALTVLAGGGLAIYEAARLRADRIWASELTGGDPAHGPRLMTLHGCAGCHEIPGVPGADGRVGPPLRGLAERIYIAGVLPNKPANLIRWVRAAREVDPRSAMPSTGMSESEARDVAAYLYSLR